MRSVSDPDRYAEIASGLKVSSQGELVSHVAKLSRLLDSFFVHIFINNLNGMLKKELEELSSALEDLHDAIVLARPQANDEVVFCLIASVLEDVEKCIERMMASKEREIEKDLKELGEARLRLERISDALRNIAFLGPHPSARDVLATIRRFMPDEGELGGYLIVMKIIREFSKEKDFPKVLAELISSWFSKSKRGRGRCMRVADIRAWVADVLKMEVASKDVKKAVKLLIERGDVFRARSKKGLLVFKPKEEDIETVFELARERYRETGSGVSAQLLSQRFNWCLEYASAIIEELVKRGWLFPGPSQLIPGAEEYYPLPEGEEP